MLRQIYLIQLKTKSALKMAMALAILGALSACGEQSAEEANSEETDADYVRWEYPYEEMAQLEASESALLEPEEPLKAMPFRNHHEIEFPLHWMYFDRPIMLYIDDPPGFNDSLFVY